MHTPAMFARKASSCAHTQPLTACVQPLSFDAYAWRPSSPSRLLRHQAGVLSISYCADYNFLISAGVETSPLLWVISASTKDRPFVLRDPTDPHKAPISCVTALSGTAQVASLDVKGMLKIWDVRTFECLYTLHCERHKARQSKNLRPEQWASVVYLPAERQLAINSDQQLYVFEYTYAVTGVEAPADAKPIRSCAPVPPSLVP